MEQNVLVTKMIGIVVAIIVAAVVLVPICNSLAESDGGSGGGSGSGGGGTEEAVYTFGEAYRQVYPDWPYESYRVYNSTVQGSSPFSITTSDIVGVLDNFRSMNIARDFFILLAQITVDTLQIDASIMVNEYTEGGLEYRATFMIQPFDGDSYNVYVFDTHTAQNEQQGKQGSFEFVCSSNGAYTLNMTYYDYNAGAMQSNSYSGQTSFISFLSENEEGYYDLLGAFMSNGLVICPLSEGQDCVVPYSYIHFLEDDSEEYGASVFNANITLNTSDMEFEITGLPEGVRIWGGIASTDSGYIASDLSNYPLFSSTEYPYEGEIYPMDIYLPTRTDTEGGGDSGGDGGSSDLGTVGTLIKTIPIFVILGILMGAVGLFYYNRNDPGL